MHRAIWLVALVGCSSNPVDTCAPACATGYECQGGACVFVGGGPDGGGDGGGGCQPACAGLTPYCNGSNHCVGCTMDAQCPSGHYCKVTSNAIASCAIGCMSDDRCGGGAMKCCNMTCVDTASDPGNCGACGKACSAPNEQASCGGGQCQPGTCNPGWGDCDGNAQNGCEANLHVDPANCTACGMKCAFAHGNAACADGCYLTACQFGFADCDNNMGNGCETSVVSDPNNCGGCGTPCKALPNATASCTAGNCVLGACNMGFADCDKNPMNGCEANLSTDAMNCNGCGNVCPMNLPYCSNGVCGLAPPCDPNLEVTYMGHCYYLDGSGGKCDPGYALASQSVLTNIHTNFGGKNYKHVVSDNCCIWNADANENWGMAAMCNAPGPFAANAVALGGAGCTNVQNHNPMQLTLCSK